MSVVEEEFFLSVLGLSAAIMHELLRYVKSESSAASNQSLGGIDDKL